MDYYLNDSFTSKHQISEGWQEYWGLTHTRNISLLLRNNKGHLKAIWANITSWQSIYNRYFHAKATWRLSNIQDFFLKKFGLIY